MFAAVLAHQVFTLALLLVFGVLPVVNYDLAVRIGVKRETEERVGPCVAEAANALSIATSFVFLPVQAAAVSGLVRGRRWGVPLAAASAAVGLFAGVLVLALNRELPSPNGALDGIYGTGELAFHVLYLASAAWSLYTLSARRAELLGTKSKRG